MQIFLSWSGEVSRQVASALRDWLPLVIQSARPWMSQHDIEAGTRWGPELSKKLATTQFGILCLTSGNLAAPWIHFEAGALSKQLEDRTRVIPLLFKLDISHVPKPLQQFQSVAANKEGIKNILESLNSLLGDTALTTDALDKTFNKWWDELEARLAVIEETDTAPTPPLDINETLRELLLTVRGMSRDSDLGVSDQPASNESLSHSITLRNGGVVTVTGEHARVARMLEQYCTSRNVPLDSAVTILDDIHRVFSHIKVAGIPARRARGIARELALMFSDLDGPPTHPE